MNPICYARTRLFAVFHSTGRNEATLEPVLKFLSKYMCVPNYTPVLMEVCGVVVDMYTKIIGQVCVRVRVCA